MSWRNRGKNTHPVNITAPFRAQATPPSPHPDGGLFLLPAVPANFLAANGPGVTLASVPTAYGLVDFVARRAAADAISVSFKYSRHAGGFSVPLKTVSMRLVTPHAKGVHAARNNRLVQSNVGVVGTPDFVGSFKTHVTPLRTCVDVQIRSS